MALEPQTAQATGSSYPEEARRPDLRRYYSEWWENPKDPRNVVFSKLNELVRSRLPVCGGKIALDLGSGKGTIVDFLLANGFEVTSVEINEDFARQLRRRFPRLVVTAADAREMSFKTPIDLVTAVEFVQNLEAASLRRLLHKLALVSGRLHLNISNSHSLHGWWTRRRGFQLPFVHTHTPREIESWLGEAGFRVVFARGVGLLTPLTLWSGFKGKFVPIRLAKAVNYFGDRLFPRLCHLYYLEAENTSKNGSLRGNK